MNKCKPKETVSDLHRKVSEDADRLAKIHGDRIKCKLGCSSCCIDGLSVFNVEANSIRDWVGGNLHMERPSERGTCAFLSTSGACRIYPVRPYVCRTQGLPLRWIDFESASERRDICHLNEPGPDLVQLSPESCWEIGPVEMKLRKLETDGPRVRAQRSRVSLRDLFGELSDKPEA